MAPAAKRRKLNQAVEITFDPDARQEYLTGFHKRKQQRIQNARDTAVKKEKEDKTRERRQIRERRKEDLERHVAEVNAELRKQNPDDSEAESSGVEVNGENGEEQNEWEGIEEVKPAEVVAQDEEYVDEDKYTTVTVEAMGEPGDESEADDTQADEVAATKKVNGDSKAPKKRLWSKDGKAKAKKRKFRYESKAERSANRQKQKSRNHAAKLRREGK